jgi:hypothetical protein
MQSYEEQARGYSSERTSQTSFATAEDFWIGEEGASSPNYAYQHTQMLHTPPQQQLDWFDGQPSSQPQVDDDDRSTIVGDSRRGSLTAVTWEGGRAM